MVKGEAFRAVILVTVKVMAEAKAETAIEAAIEATKATKLGKNITVE
jgi:hypothetical protein